MAHEKSGLIFDIERFATKDGPGIRTVVFLKGCPLRCQWCQNPESQLSRVEVIYDAEKCADCRRCIEHCPSHAIRIDSYFGLLSDPEICEGCGLCTETCYYNARKLVGHAYSVPELIHEVCKDKSYYENSGGGVTFSGGEPLRQSDFLLHACRACRQEQIHTAIETCGNVAWQVFNNLIDELDLIELNEAFAIQALVCIRELGFDVSKTNVNGGAVALGHPLGCTGARLMVTLLHEMKRRAAAGERMRYGLATLCVGIGQGCATLVERPA